MPRGVPAKGFRMTKKRMNQGYSSATVAPIPHQIFHQHVETHETDAQIEKKLADRFLILDTLTKAAIDGQAKAVIISGPTGLGKSYAVEQAINEFDPKGEYHTFVKGYVRATGLYKILHQYRHPDNLIIFDDADTIFFDDTSLNMIKAVCDTCDKRTVSYLSEYILTDDETGLPLPKRFEFEGKIIFITNYDFDAMIAKAHKLSPHLAALVSRAHYVDLAMKTRRDYIIRIKQVLKTGLLKKSGLNSEQEQEVMDFVEKNADKMRELSIRVALKVAAIRKTNPNWEKIARVTCCKND